MVRHFALPVMVALVLCTSCSSLMPLAASGRDSFFRTREEYSMEEDIAGIESSLRVTSREGQAERETDLRFEMAGSLGRLSIRRQSKGEVARTPFFVEAFLPASTMSMTAGYFAPDLGAGLAFSATSRGYPFSAGFPVRRSRHLVRRVSFYGSCVRGGALSAGGDDLRILLFSGRAGYWSGNGFREGMHRLSAARLEFGLGTCSAAVTLSGSGGSLCAGIDISSRRAGLNQALELVIDGSRRISGLYGLRRKMSRGVMGLRLFGCGRRDAYGTGGIASAGSRTFSASAGSCLLIEARGIAGSTVSMAADRSFRLYGSESKSQEEYRLALSGRCGGLEVRAGWFFSARSRMDLMPLPPLETPAVEKEAGLSLLVRGGKSKGARLRFSARLPYGKDSAGIAGSLVLSVGKRSSSTGLDLVATAWSSIRGAPAMYIYEPVLMGGYPWKGCYGKGVRLAALAGVKAGPAAFSASCRWDRVKGPLCLLQILYEF